VVTDDEILAAIRRTICDLEDENVLTLRDGFASRSEAAWRILRTMREAEWVR
jgi:hypothetical protein